MEKMVQLLIPDQFYNWLKDFFSGYSHCIKWSSSSDNGADSVSSNTAPHWEISELADILASIIQGSAIGTAVYLVTAA